MSEALMPRGGTCREKSNGRVDWLDHWIAIALRCHIAEDFDDLEVKCTIVPSGSVQRIVLNALGQKEEVWDG
ncbi:hypothetical protein Tco_0983407 [Tanacetum coccineum]